MFLNLDPVDRERIIRMINVCPFCMTHAAVAECYGRGTESKPACPTFEGSKKYAKGLDNLLMKGPSMVIMVGWEEDKEEEGCVNVITGEDDTLEG